MEDSRLKGYNGTVTHPTLPLERTFCSKCGRPWGWSAVDSSQFIAPTKIQVICDPCFDDMNRDAQSPPTGLVVPPSYLQLYGLIDENDPRVKDLKESTQRQEQVLKQFLAEKKLACPNCGSGDYHLEDNPDNPAGPQVAICHPCTRDGGLRKGWLLRERIEIVLTLI
jgi:hypothetical protein